MRNTFFENEELNLKFGTSNNKISSKHWGGFSGHIKTSEIGTTNRANKCAIELSKLNKTKGINKTNNNNYKAPFYNNIKNNKKNN